MNEHDAKVPNDEKDWSIEVYVFSNGQKFSPPRKYHLRASELNIWEDTLDQLAQSHYGQQCPLQLFTIDGQLVEGPLGLRDGQAYVAVPEPDRFIDAGYQQYLMKASRSWEKRQARRKVKECVPNEPCCLCPEKEWCCDPQTCCECPEKEDSFTQDSLMAATGQQTELRSSGGHYMGSASAKTDAANDYGPRSNRTRPAMDQHATDKPNEFRANADQIPELSENRARSNESGPKLGENIRRSDEREANMNYRTPRLIATEVIPGERDAKSNENRPRLSKNGERPVGYEARLEDNAGTCENVPKLSKNGDNFGEHGARPGENASEPVRPSESITRLADNETISEIRGIREGNLEAQYDTKPVENMTRPTVATNLLSNGTKPGENRAKLGERGIRLNESGVNPSEPVGELERRSSVNSAKPGKHGVKPRLFGTKTGEEETQPIGNGSKTGQYGATLGEHETRSNVGRNKPDENRAWPDDSKRKPSKNELRSGEDLIKSLGETKLIGNGSKTSKTGQYGAREVEHEIRSNASRDKPGVCRAWPDDSGVRPGDSGGNSSKSEHRSGEDVIKSSVNILKPGHIEPWSSESEPIKEEKSVTDLKETLDHVEHEMPALYEETEGVQLNKKNESKGRANGFREKSVSDFEKNGRENVTVTGVAEPRTRINENARRPSEQNPPVNIYKRKPSESKGEIEHTRRMSGKRGADIQLGGRTAERNREFEHGGRLSEQKGRESNFASRVGGKSAKENETRLSEQRNKQIENLVRLSSHENKALVLGMKTIDPDSRLRNPSPRVHDSSAKVNAPAPRPVTRDRINSKLRMSDLGQFKSGIPISRVDETAARLSEPGIKNTVNNPGTRPASAGGNGAAGAPHISEAQQHTRKSSLYTGRPSTEKKRLSIGQNSSLLKKPTPISPALKQPVKTNKENLTKKITGKANVAPIPASNDSAKSVLLPECLPYERNTPPAGTLSTNAITNQESLTRNRAPLENIIDEQELCTISTHSLKKAESEITTSARIDTVKHVIDAITNIPQETQTEVLYEGKFLASTSVSVEVQTCTDAEELDEQQHAQEISATNESANVSSVICCPCSKRDSVVNHDDYTVSILNNGDVINLKLNIKVRNIIKSVYSCAQNCQRSRSLTDIKTSEKESQITVDDQFLPCRDSLQSIFSKKFFQHHGFAGCSPNVMVAQCAGCGRLNNPPRGDTPQCCENNFKYYILLTSSVNEDVDGSCDFNPPCRPSDQQQLKTCNSIIPVKRSFSEIALDTITTVTLSGIQRRETTKCNVINSSCQTNDSQSDGIITRQKVSITESSVTTPAISLIAKHSCLKLCPEICTEAHKDSHVCSQTDPVPCEKVPSACSQTCSKVMSKGCPEIDLPLQIEGCQETCPSVQMKGCQQTCPPVQMKGCQQTCPPEQMKGCQQTCPPEQMKGCQQTCPPAQMKGCQQTCPPEQMKGCQQTCPPEQMKGCQQTCPPEQMKGCQQTCPLLQMKGCQQTCPPEQMKGCQQTCPPAQMKGCQQTCPPVQSVASTTGSTTCPSRPVPLPCIQILTQVCPQGPHVRNTETQTQWRSLILQARLHCDGRYSFHLPPLNMLNHFPF